MTVLTAPPGAGAIGADRIPGGDVNTREGITPRAICFSDETQRMERPGSNCSVRDNIPFPPAL